MSGKEHLLKRRVTTYPSQSPLPMSLEEALSYSPHGTKHNNYEAEPTLCFIMRPARLIRMIIWRCFCSISSNSVQGSLSSREGLVENTAKVPGRWEPSEGRECPLLYKSCCGNEEKWIHIFQKLPLGSSIKEKHRHCILAL